MAQLSVSFAATPLLLKKIFADGSIMPRVTTGNTMAPCVIIGERAADALKAQHKL